MTLPSGRVITYTRDGVKRIQIITETDLQGNLIKDYVWSNQMMPVAQIDAVIPAQAGIQSIETITYLYTDHLMTNRLATGQSKAIVWRWEGEAFGNIPAQELGTISVNLRFPGQYYDSETNLHYNMMRYYDPALGRYITSDPVGILGGTNTYSYVLQNPISLTDPTGLHHDGTGCRDFHGNRIECPRDVCATAECAAGILPNPPPPTEEEKCIFKCNAIASIPCALTLRRGWKAFLACRASFAAGCYAACKDEEECED